MLSLNKLCSISTVDILLCLLLAFNNVEWHVGSSAVKPSKTGPTPLCSGQLHERWVCWVDSALGADINQRHFCVEWHTMSAYWAVVQATCLSMSFAICSKIQKWALLRILHLNLLMVGMLNSVYFHNRCSLCNNRLIINDRCRLASTPVMRNRRRTP